MVEFVSGNADKSDAKVVLSLPEGRKVGAGTGEVRLRSTVGALFGKRIRALVEDFRARPGFPRCHDVAIEDDGALDFTLAARLESAWAKRARAAGAEPPPVTARPRALGPRKRLRRTRMYIPGNTPNLMLNAGLYGADCLILDLEDSVPPEAKEDARHLVHHLLRDPAPFLGRSEIIVRINPLAGEFGEEDLRYVMAAPPDCLLIPKCETAADVQAVDRLVTRWEAAYGVAGQVTFMPLIETAKGVVHAYEVAAASPRNVALCFGAEDFTRDMQVEKTREGRETLLARQHLALAARAAGIDAIDTVFADFADEAGLVASTREAMSLGYCGKGVIHPSQIKVVNAVFDPSPAEVERAREVVAAFEAARAAGKAAVALNGRMVDPPVYERALRTLRIAEAAAAAGKE